MERFPEGINDSTAGPAGLWRLPHSAEDAGTHRCRGERVPREDMDVHQVRLAG